MDQARVPEHLVKQLRHSPIAEIRQLAYEVLEVRKEKGELQCGGCLHTSSHHKKVGEKCDLCDCEGFYYG